MSSTQQARTHFDRVLGQDGAVVPEVLGGNDHVGVLAYADTHDPIVHCVTLGACELEIAALHRCEFVCSVRPGQQEAARFLLTSTVDIALRGGRMVLGSTITNASALLARTDIRGVLLTSGMWFEDLDLVVDTDGRIALHVITLLPLTGTDIAYLDGHDPHQLEEMLEVTGADVLDIARGMPG